MPKRKPEPTWFERKAAARRFSLRMIKFAIRKDGREKLADGVVRDMLDRFGGNLRSASVPARIAFARAVRRSARRHLLVTSQCPTFMVTFVPCQFAFPYSEALTFDWTELQRWADDALKGLDYLGIVEVSYYTSHPVPNMSDDVCHFHVHAIVWNTHRSSLEVIRQKTNESFPAFLPGRPCMKINAYSALKMVRLKLAYFLKPLMTEYRGYPLKGGAAAGWGQKKRDLRSGKAANALRLFQGIDINDLCIAGGEGETLLREATESAKSELTRREARRWSRLTHLLG